MTEADLPGPTPGADRVIRENGHMITITTVARFPRPSYRLECADCETVIHEETTGPRTLVALHVVNRPINWPEGLDWNNTGRWAVVMLIPGSSSDRWTIHPSVSVSRWESGEHAERMAADRRKENAVFTAVLDWGDDLKGLVGARLLSVPRVRAALEAQGVSFQES